MALKDLLKAADADRYTQDGRDELNAALQADVEDRTYKTGEISQKTGLQKQPDGSWAPPKKGGAGKPKSNVPGNIPLNNEYYKDDVRTEAGARKILSETKTEAIQSRIKDLETLKENNGGKLGPQGEKELQMNKEELAKRSGNAEVGLHEGEANMPEFAQSYKLLSEEHDQDALESNAKLYPELQPLVKQRDPFVKKRIAAYTKLRDNPNNPQARADFVDASNAINQIDADIDRAYKKATAGDSAPRELTGDTKIRIRK